MQGLPSWLLFPERGGQTLVISNPMLQTGLLCSSWAPCFMFLKIYFSNNWLHCKEFQLFNPHFHISFKIISWYMVQFQRLKFVWHMSYMLFWCCICRQKAARFNTFDKSHSNPTNLNDIFGLFYWLSRNWEQLSNSLWQQLLSTSMSQ